MRFLCQIGNLSRGWNKKYANGFSLAPHNINKNYLWYEKYWDFLTFTFGINLLITLIWGWLSKLIKFITNYLLHTKTSTHHGSYTALRSQIKQNFSVFMFYKSTVLMNVAAKKRSNSFLADSVYENKRTDERTIAAFYGDCLLNIIPFLI